MTSTVLDRLTPESDGIALMPFEMPFYLGYGWMIANFKDGFLTACFNPMDVPFTEGVSLSTDVDRVIACSIDWLKGREGECWLSFFQFGRVYPRIRLDCARDMGIIAPNIAGNILPIMLRTAIESQRNTN